MSNKEPDLIKSYKEGIKDIQLNSRNNGFIATINGVTYNVTLNKDCLFEYYQI